MGWEAGSALPAGDTVHQVGCGAGQLTLHLHLLPRGRTLHCLHELSLNLQLVTYRAVWFHAWFEPILAVLDSSTASCRTGRKL